MKSFKQIHEALSLDDVNKIPGKKEVSVFLGRMQPPTLAHISIIENAYKRFRNPVAIAVVKSNNQESPFPFKLIKDILKKSTKAKIIVFEIKSGFIGDFISPLRDKGMEPTVLLAGTDRVKSYRGQIKRYEETFSLDLDVHETIRTDEDISASKVRQALWADDHQTFGKMTAKGTWGFYNKLRSYLKI